MFLFFIINSDIRYLSHQDKPLDKPFTYAVLSLCICMICSYFILTWYACAIQLQRAISLGDNRNEMTTAEYLDCLNGLEDDILGPSKPKQMITAKKFRLDWTQACKFIQPLIESSCCVLQVVQKGCVEPRWWGYVHQNSCKMKFSSRTMKPPKVCLVTSCNMQTWNYVFRRM